MATARAGRAAGNQRSLLFDAGRTEERERLRNDVFEVETRVIEVGQLGRAEVTTREPRMFDHDGIGQALLALPFFHH